MNLWYFLKWPKSVSRPQGLSAFNHSSWFCVVREGRWKSAWHKLLAVKDTALSWLKRSPLNKALPWATPWRCEHWKENNHSVKPMSPLGPQKRQTVWGVLQESFIYISNNGFRKWCVSITPVYLPGLYFVWYLMSSSVHPGTESRSAAARLTPGCSEGDRGPARGRWTHTGVNCYQGGKPIKAKKWVTRR